MSFKTSTPIKSALFLGLSIAINPIGTYAQGQRLLEEVIVTATKRAENQQDVPISISAFSGDSLNEIGLTKSTDLGDFIPGLEIGTSSGEGAQLLVFMRGAGLNDFNNNNAGPIGIYADEVYISSPILTAFQFFDTERLEVLKGPQGTLYGRNTTGGAIKFISKKPTDEFSLDFRGSYGNYDRTDIEAAVSGPLTDRIRARVAVSKVDDDGWLENLENGKDENGVDTASWRGTLDFDISDVSFLRVNVHGANVDQPSFKFGHLGTEPGGADVLGYTGPTDSYEGRYNREGEVDVESSGGYLQLETEIGGLSLTSVTAYDEVESLIEEETDASPLDLLTIDYGVESATFSQELRLEGSSDQVEWLAGVFYLDEDLDQDQTVDLFRELRPFLGGGSDPTGAILGAPILFARTLNSQTLETYAAFGQLDYSVSDQLTLTAGLRYTSEKRTFDAAAALEDEITFGPNPLPIYDFKNLEIDEDDISWRLGADYNTEKGDLIYVSVARGFKSGGFNGGFLSLDAAEAEQQVQPYDPEFLTAYEIGLKSEFLDNKLRVNAAIFYNDFEDLQVFTLVNTNALPIQVLDNSSAGEVYGLEFDVLWYPTDAILVNVTGSLMDSELKDFVSQGGQDFSGNTIARTPETSMTALLRYDFDIADYGSAFVQTSVAYKSEQFFSTENSPILEEDAYSLVNARIGFRSNSERWGLAVFLNNALDKDYRTNSTDISDFGIVTNYVGAPRTYGVEFTYNL